MEPEIVDASSTPGKGAPGSGTKEFLYKVLVIGEFGVGKTSIIKRYTEGEFSSNYKLTIGVDFALKTIMWNSSTKVNLQLWDIAGHERFGHMTRVYYKYAIAAIVVFDLSRPATLDAVPKWIQDVHSKVMLANGEPIPVVLLANKCDLENVTIDSDRLNGFCKEYNISAWFPTSAKDDINIEEAIQYLMQTIMGLSGGNVEPPDHITLSHRNRVILEDDDPTQKQDKQKCCGS